MVQKEMPYKGIAYLELWQPFCSTERNHLGNILVDGIISNHSVKLF